MLFATLEYIFLKIKKRIEDNKVGLKKPKKPGCFVKN